MLQTGYCNRRNKSSIDNLAKSLNYLVNKSICREIKQSAKDFKGSNNCITTDLCGSPINSSDTFTNLWKTFIDKNLTPTPTRTHLIGFSLYGAYVCRLVKENINYRGFAISPSLHIFPIEELPNNNRLYIICGGKEAGEYLDYEKCKVILDTAHDLLTKETGVVINHFEKFITSS